MESAKSTAAVLEELKAMGIYLAVDEFGTGYSSLSYLRQFPIDVLKIDQSFIRQITCNSDDSTIITAIISMGRGLRHTVIAEGIETDEQRAYLESPRCEEGQVFFSAVQCPLHNLADGYKRESPRHSLTDGVRVAAVEFRTN